MTNGIGTYKITYILERDYGIHVSVGRVYRLMNSMLCPPCPRTNRIPAPQNKITGLITTTWTSRSIRKSPDLVRVSNITCLKAAGKWYYLCIVMDLFSRKVFSRELSPRADSGLVITTFRKAISSADARIV